MLDTKDFDIEDVTFDFTFEGCAIETGLVKVTKVTAELDKPSGFKEVTLSGTGTAVINGVGITATIAGLLSVTVNPGTYGIG